MDHKNSRSGARPDSVESDARGQFARTRKGAHNDGTVSANPRVISGDETGDATFPIENHRESGARKSVEKADPSNRPTTTETYDRGDQPPKPYGLTEPVESPREQVERQSDEQKR